MYIGLAINKDICHILEVASSFNNQTKQMMGRVQVLYQLTEQFPQLEEHNGSVVMPDLG